MTVSVQTNSDAFDGDGTDAVLPTTFPFIDAGDLVVTSRVKTTGVETVLTLTTHYTVTGGDFAIGNVTVVDGATNFPSTVEWTVSRVTPSTQLSDYVENDAFGAQTHEEALDKLTMLAIDREEKLNRALIVPISDSDPGELPNEIDRASKFLGFDAAGDPIAASGVPDTAVVSAFGETLIDDADAATARATLNAEKAVVTTFGDLIAGNVLGEVARFPLGTVNEILRSTGTFIDWVAPSFATGLAANSILQFPRNHLAGLKITRTSTTEINIAAGECRVGSSSDPNLANFINTNAAFGKTFLDPTGDPWASGDGNPGVGLGAGFAASVATWHFFALWGSDNVVDVGYDTSLTAANLIADSAVTTALGATVYYRRLFSFVSSATPTILDFKHLPGGRFMQVVPILDYTVNATDFTGGVTITLDQIPLGIDVVGLLRVGADAGTADQPVLIQALHETNAAVSLTVAPLANIPIAGAAFVANEFAIDVDTSQQIRVRVLTDATMDIDILVLGWIDDRGKDD